MDEGLDDVQLVDALNIIKGWRRQKSKNVRKHYEDINKGRGIHILIFFLQIKIQNGYSSTVDHFRRNFFCP